MDEIYSSQISPPPRDATITASAAAAAAAASSSIDASRICVTNGASAALSSVVLKFADPSYTRRIFMIEPTYFLACPIFEDGGFRGRLRGIPEGEGEDCVDLEFLLDELSKVGVVCLRMPPFFLTLIY